MNDQINQKEPSKSNIHEEEEGFSFKTIISKFLAFIPYFVISLVLSLAIAFLVNRYADSRYLVKGTILIKEKGGRAGTDGAESFLQGMQLLSTNRNIENEQGILKSKSMVEATIKNLDFGISYYSIGSINKTDLFGNLPFMVELDSNHVQVLQGDISIRFLNTDEIEVWIEKGGNIFVPKTGEILQRISSFKKTRMSVKNNIQSEWFSFKLTVLDPNILKNSKNEYSFRLNPITSIINEYNNSYAIKPITKSSSIFEISKEGAWPEKDKVFINELFKTYIQTGLDEKNKVTQSTVRFIDQQLSGLADTLGIVEDQMKDFRSINKIVNLSATGNYIIQNVGELEKKKAEEELKNKYYNYLENYISKSNPLDELVAPSVMGINEPIINSVLQKLIDLYTRKKTLELTYNANNPILIETNQTLLSLKSTLLENLKSVKASSKIIINDLNQRISGFETQISTLPGTEQKLLNMTRKYVLSDKLYTYLLEKRAEAGIAGAGINSDNKIIDEAEQIRKIYPIESYNYIIAFVIGLLLPLLLILGFEFLNHNIQNHSQLQHFTKIPLVGSIAHNTKATALVIANHPKSQISESFRNLRSNISYLAGKEDKKVILVTSTISGEGKTFISMNLASVLAIGGFRTLLIGVDLRKPKIFQDFKLDNTFGLTNYLIGKLNKDEIVQKTDLMNLDIVTAGPTPPNPSELIMSNAFYELLEVYKKEYDYIILDTPPIGLVADGLDIMKNCDIALYVARQNVTKKNYFNLINEIYSSGKVKSIGLIFNDINFAPVYGYGYGAYGYGYGYGSGYGYGYGYGYGQQYGYGETEVDKKPFWKRIFGI
ncbi:MAG: polysaccharide biosynthesis tyrosine autokinase [Bacteroidota bacterium]|nr:polysaccharide biosynthesis tyrosine autokinase [Bacteroidota bacterium]